MNNDVDIEKFKETVNANCEMEINFAELIQNIDFNDDGNIESLGGGLHVVMSPDYEIIILAGGVSDESSRKIMDSNYECDIDE